MDVKKVNDSFTDESKRKLDMKEQVGLHWLCKK